jgi:hypothetical protein
MEGIPFASCFFWWKLTGIRDYGNQQNDRANGAGTGGTRNFILKKFSFRGLLVGGVYSKRGQTFLSQSFMKNIHFLT